VPDCALVETTLNEVAQSFESDAFDGLAQESLAVERGLGAGGANRRARELMRVRAASIGLLGVVSGKAALSRLSAWAQTEYGVSLSAASLARELLKSEIDEEIGTILGQIEG
jgi:hypothetical protein